jgi:hypothetical protein
MGKRAATEITSPRRRCAEEISRAWQRGVDSIIETGRLIAG